MITFITECYGSQIESHIVLRPSVQWQVFVGPFQQRDNDPRDPLLALARCLRSLYQQAVIFGGCQNLSQNLQIWVNMTLKAINIKSSQRLTGKDHQQMNGFLTLIFVLWDALLSLASHAEYSQNSRNFGSICHSLGWAFDTYIKDGRGGLLDKCGTEVVSISSNCYDNNYTGASVLVQLDDRPMEPTSSFPTRTHVFNDIGGIIIQKNSDTYSHIPLSASKRSTSRALL